MRERGRGAVEAAAHRIEQQVAGSECAVVRVRTVDHVPRRLACARFTQGLCRDTRVTVVVAEALPVTRRDAPGSEGIGAEFLQAFVLRVFGEVEPQLQQQHAFCHQHPLEVADPLQVLGKCAFLAAPLGAIDDRTRVPRTEEHADVALSRQRSPEGPHERTPAVGAITRFEGLGADMARVHPFVEEVDGLALAGAIDTAHEDEHGKIGFLQQPELRVQQRLAEFRFFALVAGLGDAVADFGGFEHGKALCAV